MTINAALLGGICHSLYNSSLTVMRVNPSRFLRGQGSGGKQMILSVVDILDFLEGIFFQLFPEGGEVGGEGNLVGAVGLV